MTNASATATGSYTSRIVTVDPMAAEPESEVETATGCWFTIRVVKRGDAGLTDSEDIESSA